MDDQLDAMKAEVQTEIGRITDKETWKAAKKVKYPIFSRILEAKERSRKIQNDMLDELIESSIAITHSVKQKAIGAVEEWLENFISDKDRLLSLNPSQAKTLLSIAYTADQMYRLEVGKSTSNVAVAHTSASEKSKLDSAMEKLQEVDPVFDYSKYKAVGMQQAELLPEPVEGIDGKIRVLEAGGSVESGAGGDRATDQDGEARGDDGGPLSPDKHSSQEAPTPWPDNDSESSIPGPEDDNPSPAGSEHGED